MAEACTSADVPLSSEPACMPVHVEGWVYGIIPVQAVVQAVVADKDGTDWSS